MKKIYSSKMVICLLTVLTLLVAGRQSYAQSVAYASNSTNIPIPDAGDWVWTTLTFSGIPEDHHIYYMDLGVHINHTWAGDLEIALTDPSNTYGLGIVDRPGVPDTTFGTSANLGTLNIFNDYELVESELMGAGMGTGDLIIGNYKPSWIPGSIPLEYSTFEDLAKNFTGLKNGSWMVWVKDDSAGDIGNIEYVDSQIFYDRYCVPFILNNFFEHITNVTFAEINHSSGAYNFRFPEYFTTAMGNESASINRGGVYPLSVSIEPDFNEYIYAYFDWNQDGDFDDPGETYTVASNVNTTGPFVVDIQVPADAVLGETRMRIQLIWHDTTANPCVKDYNGEVEDYTVTVGLMGTDETVTKLTSVYPNPFTDIVNFSTKDKIKSIEILNLLGQQLMSTKENTNVTSLNLSTLTSGVYIAKINTTKGVETVKLIKK